MFYLLNPRVWIAVIAITALGVTHFATFRAGKGVVRAEWNKEKVVQLEAARQQEAAFRKKERELVSAKQLAEEKYAQLKKRNERSAADTRLELDRLRDQLAAAPALGGAAEDPAALARAAGGTGLERELLGACASALVGMAATADGLEARIVGLQSYVKNVCLAK